MPVIKPIKGKYYIKWFGQRYLDAAAGLQCYSSHRFMPKNLFLELMTTEPRSDGLVVTDVRNHVLAYILYRHHPEDELTHFIDLVVHPDHRGKGLGRFLVNGMMHRQPCYFRGVLATAREDNLLSHKFLQANGFVAYNIVENFFEEISAYCFIYSEYKNEINKACGRKHE